MSNANRDYVIVYDVKNSSLVLSRPLRFYITDKNTSNIFVRLVTKVSTGHGIDQYTDIEEASNYVLTMKVIKPNNEVKSIEATQYEPESIFQFDLTEDFKDMPGKYICELTISTIVNGRQELITSDPFNYEVKRSILSNVGEIIETENNTVEKLLNDLDATKAELSSQIKEITTKKIYQFDSVASMKAYELKTGEVCETLGYYRANDGGGGKYYINSSTTDISDCLNIKLDNGLFATLVVENDSVIAEQIGIQKGTDNDNTDTTPFILEFFKTYKYLLKFDVGNYYFSECLFGAEHNPRVRIKGQSNIQETRTFFKPKNPNQRFIIKLGGNADFSEPSDRSSAVTNFLIDGIFFRDDNNPIISSNTNPLECGLLCLDQCFMAHLDIGFWYATNQCIYLRDSYEICFENIHGRYLNNMPLNSNIFYSAPNTASSSNNNNNNSNIVIKHMDLEELNSHICTYAGTFNNNHIGTVIIENGRDNIFSSSNVENLYRNVRDNYVKHPYFNIISGSGYLSIDTINCDHSFNGSFTKDGVNYIDSLLYIMNKPVSVDIKEVLLCSNAYPFIQMDNSTEYTNSLANVNISNITIKPPHITKTNILQPLFIYIDYLNNNYSTGSGKISINQTNGIIDIDKIFPVMYGSYNNDNLLELIEFKTDKIYRNANNPTCKYSKVSVYAKAGSNISRRIVFPPSANVDISVVSAWSENASTGICCKIMLYDENKSWLQTISPPTHSIVDKTRTIETFTIPNIEYAYAVIKCDFQCYIDYIRIY